MATNPSLAMIPSGYKDGVLYSVLPNTSVGDFDVSRGSAATRVNKNGLIETVGYTVGGELITNGEFVTDSDWDKGTGWTISGGKAVSNSSVGFQSLSQPNAISNSNGKTFKCNFTISGYSSGLVALYISGFINNSYFVSANGDYEIYVYVTSGTNGNIEFLTNSTGFTGSIDNVSVIEWAGSDIPRLDYTGGGCPVLLTEPQSTNEITYSEEFGNAYWTKDGASIEGSVTSAESGTDYASGWDFTGVDWLIGGTATKDNSTTITLPIGGYVRNKFSGVTAKTVLIRLKGTFSGAGSGFSVADYDTNNVKNVTDSAFDEYIWLNSVASQEPIALKYYDGDVTVIFTDIEIYELADGFQSPSADSPLGAFKLVEGTNTGNHSIKSASVTGQTDLARDISFFIKTDGVTKIGIRNLDAKYITYDISTEATLDKTIVNDFVSTDMGNGWKRISVLWDSSTVTTGATLFLLNDAYTTGNPLGYSYTGDGTSGVYLFGAQLEELPFATSYIPTSGGTATRLGETVTGAGDASTFNGTEGVLFFEGSAFNDFLHQEAQGIMSITDGTNDNRVRIYYRESGLNPELKLDVFSGGVNIYSYTTEAFNLGTSHKIALRYGANNFASFVDGIKVDEQLSGGSFSLGLSTFSLSQSTGSNPFYGKTSQVQVFKTALIDAEIATI